MKIKIFVALLLSAVFVSCEEYKVDEILFTKEEVSLIVKGVVVFEYDGDTCQMAYNARNNEFRAMDDDMADYFVLKCSSDISTEGQEVVADLKYTTASNVRTEKELTFKVERILPASGNYWLWCQSKKIGVVVRKF